MGAVVGRPSKHAFDRVLRAIDGHHDPLVGSGLRRTEVRPHLLNPASRAIPQVNLSAMPDADGVRVPRVDANQRSQSAGAAFGTPGTRVQIRSAR